MDTRGNLVKTTTTTGLANDRYTHSGHKRNKEKKICAPTLKNDEN